jgi:hypothetical protein
MKASKVTHAVALSKALEAIAAQVAGALHETTSLSETLGALTIEAGKEIKRKPEMLEPFADACKQLCAAHGLSEGSFKVYLSNIRGVLRAIVDGYKPEAGASLRAMYDAAPKGKGRQKSGARTEPKGDDAGETGAVTVLSESESRRAAMLVLFGHADDELDAALSWAASHEVRFMNLIKAQIEFDAKPAAPKAAPRQRKAA